MNLNELLGDEDSYEEEMPDYTDSQIQQAFVSDEPVQSLREIFKDMWPMVSKWLRIRLKSVRVDKDEADNEIGGLLRAKLDSFLNAEHSFFDENALTLTRELLSCIKDWKNHKVKPKELPQPMIS